VKEENAKVAMKRAKSSISGLFHIYRFAAIHPFMLERAIIDQFDILDVKEIIEKMARIKSPASRHFREILELALYDKELRGQRCLSCLKECETLRMELFRASVRVPSLMDKTYNRSGNRLLTSPRFSVATCSVACAS